MIGVLEKYRLDFCWAGDKSLEAAVGEAGILLETVLFDMRLALTEFNAEQADWNSCRPGCSHAAHCRPASRLSPEGVASDGEARSPCARDSWPGRR